MITPLRFFLLPAFALALLPTACGGGSSSAGSLSSCTTSTDCLGNEVCVGLGEQGACHIQCSASANECGGSASCEGIGGVSLDICKEKDEQPAATGGSAPQEEQEAEEDWLRCTTDQDCSVIDPGAVCGTWKSISMCTIPCGDSNECNPPTLGGITTTFLACSTDEKSAARSICVPREECFASPLDCMVIDPPDEPGTGGSDPVGGSGGTNMGTGGSDPFATGGGFGF